MYNINSGSAVDNAIADHSITIRDVWCYNLHEEFHYVRQVVQKYHWVAMDTEFPGVVAKPTGEFKNTAAYKYEMLRTNVDLLTIIQLGLTFMDEHGNTPAGITTWQFNFKFSLQRFQWLRLISREDLINRPPQTILHLFRKDMYAENSIMMLINSGLRFHDHEEYGIEPSEFAELLMSSGIVLMDNIRWLSFHSGYDFGYLLKLLTDQNLPEQECYFYESLRLYFRNVYDVKYLMKLCKNLRGGLQDVAAQLELRRMGIQHQAGSDSHLTGLAFFKIKEFFFDGDIESTSGHLYGLGAPTVNNQNIFLVDSWKSSSSA